jgi:Ni2+-binding GTPase involved in maturation of urease and hydrogenase
MTNNKDSDYFLREKNKMAKLHIVVGLPGSGKTRLIEEMMSAIPGICADDYMEDSINQSTLFTDSRHYGRLLKDLRAGKDCLIADIVFCNTAYRKRVAQIMEGNVPDVTIKWLFFENAPETCKTNANRRNSHRLTEELKYIDLLSPNYRIPDGVAVIKVYQNPE